MNIPLTFTVPPFGLEPLTSFTLQEVTGAEGLFALAGHGTTAAGTDDPRLFVLDAAVHLPDYAPVITEEQTALLDLRDAREAMLLVVANPAESGTTVNLLAPVIVNARTGIGAQLILEGQDHPLRAVLARR
ncbi:flagellar assembly protein FliW [Curtobacterium sp. MCBD17_028]|uniref:flagellar assembly protein FliW n=1 Tax=Curtobacterium sp. MCBD17_028 TaxID=2175670 RepID=UPI000DA746BC|nr:flagellar assembly protein FliW [Curtobacterium sp. MCBD17_028]PZE29802.1 flagellar assembly protein FliW [Curtobacterium sp. MCBD17_028]